MQNAKRAGYALLVWAATLFSTRRLAVATVSESTQEMLHGRTSLVGHGRIRDVYLVEYKDQVVVLKTLRETGDPRRQKAHFSMHRREALSLDAVSDSCRPYRHVSG